MSNATFSLSVLPDTLAVVRLEPDEPVPGWLPREGFASVTRTAHELSVVCRADAVPDDVRAARDWRCVEVQGPFDFSVKGVLASLSRTLADADVSLLAIATFDTDYLLVRCADLSRAVCAFAAAGHTILDDGSPRGLDAGTQAEARSPHRVDRARDEE
jgi:uncharacterized protein